MRDYLPRGGASHVLITSNSPAWLGLAEPVRIGLWPKQIGAEYLIKRTGGTADRAAAEDLSVALGGLPLAHEQAATYCERLGIPLAEYAKRFEATPARLLDAEKDAPAEYHDGLTVAKTFALAIEEATKLHPAAEPLIVHAALLAPEPIPLFLFSEAREKLGNPASALADDGSTKRLLLCGPLHWLIGSRSQMNATRRSRPTASGCIVWCARSLQRVVRAMYARRRGAR